MRAYALPLTGSDSGVQDPLVDVVELHLFRQKRNLHCKFGVVLTANLGEPVNEIGHGVDGGIRCSVENGAAAAGDGMGIPSVEGIDHGPTAEIKIKCTGEISLAANLLSSKG